MTLGSEIQEASSQAAELVRELGRDISNMKWSLKSSRINKLHRSTERLQRSTEHAYLLTSFLESKPLSFSFKTPQQMGELHTEKNSNPPVESIPTGVTPQTQSYHEMTRKQPSREVDAFDGDSGTTSDLVPSMRALESTAALSVTNFTFTLIEFVARLDLLIHAIDKLSKKAKFEHEPS